MNIKELLSKVASGELSPEEAERQLGTSRLEDMGFAVLDLDRESRRGRPEVVLCERKTVEQIISIARRMRDAGQNVLLTRLSPEQQDAVLTEFEQAQLAHDPLARLIHIETKPLPRKQGTVAVLAAGTSDLAVAEEAARTAEALGSPVERAYDVGVAGLHRLLRRADLLLSARVIIAVAGMEGALPSVVSGLVRAPVIAVPTSVGYGAGLGGISALLTMINGCSPGVAVVNIDNGFGAGYLADQINEIGEEPKGPV